MSEPKEVECPTCGAPVIYTPAGSNHVVGDWNEEYEYVGLSAARGGERDTPNEIEIELLARRAYTTAAQAGILGDLPKRAYSLLTPDERAPWKVVAVQVYAELRAVRGAGGAPAVPSEAAIDAAWRTYWTGGDCKNQGDSFEHFRAALKEAYAVDGLSLAPAPSGPNVEDYEIGTPYPGKAVFERVKHAPSFCPHGISTKVADTLCRGCEEARIAASSPPTESHT